jgi:cytochrome c-type biogenesis protein CcmH/NrfF
MYRDLPLIGALWAVPATLLILLVIALVRLVRERS